MSNLRLTLATPEDTAALGARLASACREGLIIYLSGELGSGKTTLARALLTAMGHVGRVRSPTYTLVEPYRLRNRNVYHFDLYRLGDPEELEFIGIREYLEPDAVWLVEWPERGAGGLPAPDLELFLRYAHPGRDAQIRARSEAGARLLQRLAES